MSAFKGTPGPWYWSPDYKTGDGRATWSLIGSDGYGILSCDGEENSPQGLSDGANARLIAAAPELLEALEQLIGPEDDPKAGWRGWTPSTEMFRCEFCGQEDLDCGRIQHDDRCPIKAARAAIAKAIGEQA